MKIRITSTDKIIKFQHRDGTYVPARIWEGTTENGIPVHAFISRIAPAIPFDDPRQSEFQRELQECAAPSADVAAYPHRMIL